MSVHVRVLKGCLQSWSLSGSNRLSLPVVETKEKPRACSASSGNGRGHEPMQPERCNLAHSRRRRLKECELNPARPLVNGAAQLDPIRGFASGRNTNGGEGGTTYPLGEPEFRKGFMRKKESFASC